MDEQAVEELHDLVVVLLDGHLQIESYKLGHMSVGVGVLRTEDGADLVDTLEVGSDGHLLGKLRRLSKECLACDADFRQNSDETVNLPTYL